MAVLMNATAVVPEQHNADDDRARQQINRWILASRRGQCLDRLIERLAGPRSSSSPPQQALCALITEATVDEAMFAAALLRNLVYTSAVLVQDDLSRAALNAFVHAIVARRHDAVLFTGEFLALLAQESRSFANVLLDTTSTNAMRL